MAFIDDEDGYFLAPAPMYETYKSAFYDALEYHESETLIPYKNRFNRGFEVPLTIRFNDENDEKERVNTYRMIILYDHGLFARKSRTLNNRIEKTEEEFANLNNRINKYRLKTREAIDKACASILKKRHSEAFFQYEIINEPIVTYKNKKPGRPAKGKKVEKIAVENDHFRINLSKDPVAVKKEKSRCGYYPLVTNKPESDLSIEEAMKAHKDQYKVEHINRRSKNGYNLEPIYLHTPERIEAFLFLFKMALQVIVLIERAARNNIEERNKGLDNFLPNRNDVRNPTAENILTAFEYVVKGEFELPDGSHYGFVSELTELQIDILRVLEVPEYCYSYDYIYGHV